jgi:hypothetical protein
VDSSSLVRIGLRPTSRNENRVGQASTPAAGLQTRGRASLAAERAYEARAGCEPAPRRRTVEKRWVFDRADAGSSAGVAMDR